MKNLLRGSLLTLIFVGMSSFGTSLNSSSERSAEIVGECDDYAETIYHVSMAFFGNQSFANTAYTNALFSCTDAGGDSFLIANP